MNISHPPGLAGRITTQLAEMVTAPRACLVLPAYLTIASQLFGRRFKDGHDPINLFMVTAAPAFAGKTRMVNALATALHSAQVGWDAHPDDMTRCVATPGIVGRPRIICESAFTGARHLHSELVRAGSQSFVVDDFRSTLLTMVSDMKLADYLSRAWGAGSAVRSLAQLDFKAGVVGEHGGVIDVWNPNATIWGLATPIDLPALNTDFWARWLVMRDDRQPSPADDIRAPWTCRVAFDSGIAGRLRGWMVDADALDAEYAAAAIQDPEGKRSPVTMPGALAQIRQASLKPLDWDAEALGELSGLTGRAMVVARRVACLVAVTDGARVVPRDIAAWAVDFVRQWVGGRDAPKSARPPSYEGFVALRKLKAPGLSWPMATEAATKLVAGHMKLQRDFAKPGPSAEAAIADLIEFGVLILTEAGAKTFVSPNFVHPEWKKPLD